MLLNAAKAFSTQTPTVLSSFKHGITAERRMEPDATAYGAVSIDVLMDMTA
jgi:hypothetical protein